MVSLRGIEEKGTEVLDSVYGAAEAGSITVSFSIWNLGEALGVLDRYHTRRLTIVRFTNGSQILAESPIPETIRGHTAKVIYLMECNFIMDDEDLYTAVLFALNATNGYLIAESTPWNSDSVFYRMFYDEAFSNFSKHRVLYTEALHPDGPLSPEIIEMIERQLARDPKRWRREMLCEWTEDLDVWLPTSLITLAQDSSIDYLPASARQHGDFFAGVDFGKHRDHSVVAVVERVGGYLYLRHFHRFPLETITVPS